MRINNSGYYCRSQLAKTKIDGTDNEKKDDSGNETGAGEGEPEEEPEIVHYDKSKSFFDNISCEAVERIKGYVSHKRKYKYKLFNSSSSTHFSILNSSHSGPWNRSTLLPCYLH